MPISEILIKNTVFREKPETPEFNPSYDAPQGSLLNRLHSSRNLIQEKAYGNVSSFNFTRDAFNGGHWNDLTTKARGLFLDNTNGKIVARGFEKFFGYKEKQFNSEQFLKENLKFPVSAYVKYNGFLGILGYNESGLLFCSKSTVGGEFAEWFKEIFEKEDHKADELLAYMREHNVGLVFEVIDPVRDPHIVEYKEQEIVLLDVISLQEEFVDVNHMELCDIAQTFNFKVKELHRMFDDWESLHAFLEEFSTSVEESEGKEGYVLVDGNGYQFKLKGAWYRRWKLLRSFKDKIAFGRLVNIAGVNQPVAVKFIGWAQKKGREYCAEKSIIDLRNEYEKHVREEAKE